jgi:hypothetical protein
MSNYDIAILRSIEAARLTERIGPKPNANPHITVFCHDDDCDVVAFEIRRSDAGN